MSKQHVARMTEHRMPPGSLVRAIVAAGLAVAIVVPPGCSGETSHTPSTRQTLASAPATTTKVPVDESSRPLGLNTAARPRSLAPGWPEWRESADTPQFPTERAMVHVRYLADELGVRKGGSDEESRAAAYVVRELRSLGYEPRVEEVPLPSKKVCRNVIAEKAGVSSRTLVLGAHLDSKPPAPGANDAATGVGALLAIAEVLAARQTTASIEFAFFGAEEIIGADPSQHHFGSRYRVASMSDAEKDTIAGMLSLDVIAVGDQLYARSMMRGPQTLVRDVIAFSKPRVPMTFKKDPGKTGWSDHEPYELAGIPAVWIESLPDPAYHTPRDVASHIDIKRYRQVGQLALEYVISRTESDLERLR